jgi:hypothetical protein
MFLLLEMIIRDACTGGEDCTTVQHPPRGSNTSTSPWRRALEEVSQSSTSYAGGSSSSSSSHLDMSSFDSKALHCDKSNLQGGCGVAEACSSLSSIDSSSLLASLSMLEMLTALNTCSFENYDISMTAALPLLGALASSVKAGRLAALSGSGRDIRAEVAGLLFRISSQTMVKAAVRGNKRLEDARKYLGAWEDVWAFRSRMKRLGVQLGDRETWHEQ